MEQNDKLVLIYSTFPSAETAAAAGESLVTARLAACVNILPGMMSIYEWEGQLHRDPEVVMLIKTRADVAPSAVAAISETHPYDNPAVIVLPIDGGATPYLDWVRSQTSTSQRS